MCIYPVAGIQASKLLDVLCGIKYGTITKHVGRDLASNYASAGLAPASNERMMSEKEGGKIRCLELLCDDGKDDTWTHTLLAETMVRGPLGIRHAISKRRFPRCFIHSHVVLYTLRDSYSADSLLHARPFSIRDAHN
jgi:hypothetical protein